MAFDAASAVQAPASGASAAAKPATRKSDASDPFGALLAMVDNGKAAKDAPKATQDSPKTSAAPKADAPDDKAAAPVKTDEDAPAKDAAPADGAASDASTLVAAMMVPAQPAPQVAAPAATPAAPTTDAPPAAAPTQILPDAAVAVDAAAVAKDASAIEAVPAAPVATAPPAKPDVAPPTPAVAAAPAPVVADAPVPTPVAPVDDTAVAAVQPVVTETVASAEPARPAEPAPAATTDQPKIETVTNQAVRNPEPRHEGAQDHSNGRPSDAEASQIAEAKKTPAPDAAQQVASLDAVADAPPAATAAAPPPVQTAAAPVIQAQAAVLPVRGSPETVAHLAAQMIQRLDGQATRFDLSLNPQSLGRVDVRIEIGAKGALKARMAFDDAASAHELSGRHAELRAALQSAGFDVPEGAITYDVASGGPGGGAFAERQDDGSGRAPVFHNLAETADQDPAAVVKNYFSAAGSSGVDIRV